MQEITENENKIEETPPPSVEENENEQESSGRFKEGQMLKFVRVRFPGNAKSFPFFLGKRTFTYGQKVVAMSDRGMTVGYINSFPYEKSFHKDMLPVKSISKAATDEDIQQQLDNIQKEKSAEVLCIDLIEKLKLEMTLTHVEFIQFGKKAVFYFTAPQRVDFRALVKELVSNLKMRIELRQISVRDRAAALGGIGVCGRQTCCSSFLSNYGNVSIKMAKNQNLALIPTKLNGVCGQIKCCIKYEDTVYSEKRKHLPKEGSFVRLKNGDTGKVQRLHVLEERFDMLTDKGAIRRYTVSMFPKDPAPPESWSFPKTFDHIVNETNKVIGEEVKPAQEEDFPLPKRKFETEAKGEDQKGQEEKKESKNSEAPQEQTKESKPERETKEKEDDKPQNKNHNRSRNRHRNNKGKSRYHKRNRPNKGKNKKDQKKETD